MFDHVAIEVGDFDASRAFYEAVPAPLGMLVVMEPLPGMAGFGAGDKPWFWVMGRGRAAVHGVHLAFAAADHAEVVAFHAVGLAAGGTDNGGPGPRPIYHPHYYAAFVLDPEGNNVEAVCHTPDGYGLGGGEGRRGTTAIPATALAGCGRARDGRGCGERPGDVTVPCVGGHERHGDVRVPPRTPRSRHGSSTVGEVLW